MGRFLLNDSGPRRSTGMGRSYKFPRIPQDNRPVYHARLPRIDELPKFKMTLTRTNPKTGFEYEMKVVGYGKYLPYVPGYTSGRPENCYEDEGGYVEDLYLYWHRPGKGWVLLDATSDDNAAVYEAMESHRSDLTYN